MDSELKLCKYVGNFTGLSKAELSNKRQMIEKIYCLRYVLSHPITLSINLWSNYFKNVQQLNMHQGRSKQKCQLLLH